MRNRKLSRRQFMTTLTAGAGTVLLGNFVQGAPPKPVPLKADPFKKPSAFHVPFFNNSGSVIEVEHHCLDSCAFD